MHQLCTKHRRKVYAAKEDGRGVHLPAARSSLLAGCGGSQSGSQSLPTIRFLADDSEAAKKYAQGLQEIFRQALGIELVLENVDFATRLQKMRDGDFDLVFAGWGADYNDPLSFLEPWVTDGPYNDVGWSNAEFDELISIARSSTDQEERMEALAKLKRSSWTKRLSSPFTGARGTMLNTPG